METQTEATLTLHVSRDMAAEIKRSAREQQTDVSTLLTRSYQAQKAVQLREHLRQTRPNDLELPQEMQDVIQSYVDEVRAERYRERGF